MFEISEQPNTARPDRLRLRCLVVTTNVGWTSIFHCIAVVVTYVGTPLSHAAIFTCLIGVPALVGYVNVSLLLTPSDCVRVDGRRGTVELM